MTVAIGAMCERGNCIITVADRRGTFAPTAGLGPHDRTGKQFDLPRNFSGNIAGVVSVCTSIISELDKQMNDMPTPFFHDHVRNAIREAQFQEFENRARYALKTQLLITVKEWKEAQIAQYLRDEGKSILKSIQLEAELIIAGFAGISPVLLEVFCNEPPEMRHFCAIGSGGNAAYSVLVQREQEPHMSFQRTLIHMAEAMEAARLDAIQRDPLNPDVGFPAAYVVVTKKAMRILPANNIELKHLVSKYDAKDTESVDAEKVCREKLRSAMWIYNAVMP